MASHSSTQGTEPPYELTTRPLRHPSKGFDTVEVEYTYTKSTGEKSDSQKKTLAMRGDASTAVVFHKERGKYILCRQFRVATAFRDGGWTEELPAGRLDEDESPEACLRRELAEEIGYEPKALTWIGVFYATPGYSDERIHLHYAEVSEEDRKGEGGGLKEEGEYIEVLELGLDEIREGLNSGRFRDGKTLVGLFWLLANHG